MAKQFATLNALDSATLTAYDLPVRVARVRARDYSKPTEAEVLEFRRAQERLSDAMLEQMLVLLDTFARQANVFDDASFARMETGHRADDDTLSEVRDTMQNRFEEVSDAVLEGSPLAHENASLGFVRALFPLALPENDARGDGERDVSAQNAFGVMGHALRAIIADDDHTNPLAPGAACLMRCAAVVCARLLQEGEQINAQIADTKPEGEARTNG